MNGMNRLRGDKHVVTKDELMFSNGMPILSLLCKAMM
jgi:hypothetical protein